MLVVWAMKEEVFDGFGGDPAAVWAGWRFGAPADAEQVLVERGVASSELC